MKRLISNLIAVFTVISFIQPAYSASIKSWGGIAFDSRELDCNDFIAIAAGYYHSLALKSDGTIVGWGWNQHGQATPPQGNDFIAIAAGRDHSLALKSDGSLIVWRSRAAPPEGNDFIAIAAGSDHSLALKSDGSIAGWGSNLSPGDWDQDDPYTGQAVPPDGNDFIAIAAGGYHSLALKSDGSIVGWGDNEHGQADPPDGNDFIAIAAGGSHSLALKSDGSIVGWGWGWNDYGQVAPPQGSSFVAIAAGEYHSLALVNTPPVAVAGPDKTVYAYIDGFADVTLDGSGSYDDDGDELDYFWSWIINANLFEADGISPAIQLPLGSHQIELVVDDGWVESEPDYCTINVIAPLKVNMMCAPKLIYPQSFDRYIMAVITMPQGINPSDINTKEPLSLLPGNVASSKPFVWQSGIGRFRRTYIMASFSKSECMKYLKTGSNKVNVVGNLNSGQYFYGTDYIHVMNFNPWVWFWQPMPLK